ncbi:MmgE/PrpD family protein [Robbsia andropogonis]|nr:MmgE/PrpD family protein [Robbsia andropogonis]MCP1119672.1 MmgE/PrpD family protein [Robbsia andropogonis]MCP1129655.1 MmgE/PrpD family protein [Robbsia andropogonis]
MPTDQQAPVPYRMPEAPGRTLAKTLSALCFEDLPPEVVETVKAFTLDTLGVIGGAAKAPGMRALIGALTAWETDGIATLLLDGRKVNPVSAAMANGAAAHSLDFDDQHDPARIHAFCVVLPAVLAAVEADAVDTSRTTSPIDGKRLLAALAIGVELFCRLGLTCYNSLGKGWHPTTALGTIASAAACAYLFGLDEVKMLDALGLGFTQLSGTTQFIADGALAKRMGPGFAARSGVLAAHLARNGLTGPARFLEGNAGLFKLYERDEIRPEILFEDLGRQWHLRDLSMKPYPCCRCTHTVIQLALDCRADGLTPDQIVSGEIELGRVNRQIVGARFDNTHPNPVVHAQFNAAYTFAAALVDGVVSIETFLPERIRAADLAWGARFTAVESATIEPTDIAPAAVRLTLHDGRIIEKRRETIKGAPNDPMSEAEVVDKFRRCMRYGLESNDASLTTLQRVIVDLEKEPDAMALLDAFAACRVSS